MFERRDFHRRATPAADPDERSPSPCRRPSYLRKSRRASRAFADPARGVHRARLGSAAKRCSARRRTELCARERDRYCLYFDYMAGHPSDEIAAVRELVVPLIKTAPVTLPFDLTQTVADNCLSLSGMGYYLGIGGCCPTCAGSGEPRLHCADRATLILAYVQQLNNIYEYRAFLASVLAAAQGDLPGFPAPEGERAEQLLGGVLAQPELFFAYHVLRDGGTQNARVLFYRDPNTTGYMMYVVFPTKSVHLHYRLIDRLIAACPGYRVFAHVWQTTFVLVVRRDETQQTDTEIPAVSAGDIYCKMCDLSFDGELLLEYKKLYSAFDDFLPPA
ncbi:nuclear egress lamina protein [Equid alphaherpesvirus 3]|uniref:Nuclear egress lamina protein n=1 Tax=Equid alphaherpesvirus 3 TaxID=80341 RepID=A0A077B9P8_9ALPH|nr:nuclear egress lamina protein [Equid alphaherpesvirus 3]AIL02946.1 nuclear egress lamina protein [Equid alphaherpesvirus 3]